MQEFDIQGRVLNDSLTVHTFNIIFDKQENKFLNTT